MTIVREIVLLMYHTVLLGIELSNKPADYTNAIAIGWRYCRLDSARGFIIWNAFDMHYAVHNELLAVGVTGSDALPVASVTAVPMVSRRSAWPASTTSTRCSAARCTSGSRG
jgi:hypothetical protein